MDSEELLGLHLSIAELHDTLLAVGEIPGMVSADTVVVERFLDEARRHLKERRYGLAVQALASAAKVIARKRETTHARA